MKNGFLMLVMVGMLMPVGAQAEDWLVTPEEARKEAVMQADGVVYRGRSATVPNSPQISLVKPGNKFVKAPFDIVVSFSASDGAKIDPASFKVLYGYFKMDITRRVAQQASVSGEGVVISHANIPSGKHQLLLNVTDSMNRTGEAEIQIEVE
ncbi:hypothetical protein OYT1_ch0908 [Ferriphaselus amnicola]|uniref:Uncharacterized protein n=1 Tax=Ferriphaselus amnicola TaxID=1188319 RepID=A0A2Z6GAA2_9PROT|nr:hypothetical protein [Ferriphaselus amnicola]BBE50471.1 hypothetical protein OYT1_ch0908 [Ferriphaselus amnicola]